MADLLDSMLDLMRRLPPTNVEENVNALVNICPEYADELLGSVDQPLQLKIDHATGREYLACDYNRDGESYRSPWSNEYDPPLDDGTIPSTRLRKLEIAANEAFDTYREMYFEGGVSSVYLWDLEDGGFAGVVVLKKVLSPNSNEAPSGSWDSIHVFEAFERGRNAHYKLTSTIMLHLVTQSQNHVQKERGGFSSSTANTTSGGDTLEGSGKGSITLSGSMTRQIEQDYPLQDASSHITNTGRMVEEQELKMRNLLQDVYFGKTRDVVHDLRSVESLEQARRQRMLQKELVGLIRK
ncbi:F-actin capping beta subunit [Pyrrhoderma noxium]|uniref:F-actin-capping protein subunit beta n=1 Tax=Pyrrhoderma noxium TaxID=2282107 RepID=A0A286U9A5_9AGAM|nr:F-actin capping beta subunit [Pyrrhoderma noxium]